MFQQKNTSENQILFKASEVAKRLNISRSMTYQLMQSGELPTVRIHNAVRVRESDLETYVQNHWTGWK